MVIYSGRELACSKTIYQYSQYFCVWVSLDATANFIKSLVCKSVGTFYFFWWWADGGGFGWWSESNAWNGKVMWAINEEWHGVSGLECNTVSVGCPFWFVCLFFCLWWPYVCVCVCVRVRRLAISQGESLNSVSLFRSTCRASFEWFSLFLWCGHFLHRRAGEFNSSCDGEEFYILQRIKIQVQWRDYWR